jgi:uncharacterized BrkB/YihY/UPF0761 family membrane protein
MTDLGTQERSWFLNLFLTVLESVMINVKSFCLLMALVSLVIVAVGLVGFGVELWSYYFGSSSGHTHPSNTSPDFHTLGMVTSGAALFGLFTLLYRWRKF